MDIIQQINSFLKINDVIILKINIEYQKIEYVYYKGDIIASDLAFDETIELCAKMFKVEINPTFKMDFLRWLKDDNVYEYALYAKSYDGIRNPLICLKQKLDENNYLVHAENLESKNRLINLIDPLINVYQKNTFNNYIYAAINKKVGNFTLCILDIDNFKSINDNYGHLVGDDVLVAVANIIKKNVSNGMVARFGGDEFEFALIGVYEYQDVWNILYKICHELKNITSELNVDFDVTATIGCARFGIDSNTYDGLFDCADRALYRGKRKGKNCFIIYDPIKHTNIIASKMYSQIEETNSSNKLVNIILNIYSILENKDNTFEEILQNVLDFLVQVLSPDRAVIYFYENDGKEKIVSASYKDKEDIYRNKMIPPDLWDEHYKKRLCVINRTKNLKNANPKLCDILQKEGIESILRCKLEYKDIRIGCIEIVSYTQHDWTMFESDVMSLVSRLISMNIYKINEDNYLKYFSSIEELTGLLNYSKFQEITFNKLNSVTKKMVIHYFNIQRFKFINDTFGFSAGDYVLKRFAQILRKLYSSGVSTRITSDRFIMVDYYDTDEIIKYKCEELLKEVHEITYRNTSIGRYLVIDVGIYVTDGTENNVSIAVDRANIARRSIGEVNVDTLQFFTDEIRESVIHKNEIIMNFSDGLRNNEFELFLQPKIEISSNKIIGCEVLSRWNYKGVLLQPLKYIPILEEAGLLIELDIYVFEKLMEFISKLKNNNISFDIPVSVNVSRNQKDFIAYVSKLDDIRKNYGIDANQIELEITESTFTQNIVDIKKLIYFVHRIGYKVSMDDFGAGYSNLSSLVDCGFDCIKIDKSLCAPNKLDKKNIVLQSVVELAQKLGIEVICEGVETSMQAANLLRLGCNKAQGFLYDKPLTITEFIDKYLIGEKNE